MTKMERCQRAKEFHEKGLNCGQSVLLAFTDVTGLTESQSMAIASGFGGGLRCGGVCGVVNAAAVVLGVGRAIGEAMAVMMVSGNVPNMPALFQSVRFLTTAVASEMGYAAAGLQRQALFSIALVLFLFIMLINAALNFFLKRSKEK